MAQGHKEVQGTNSIFFIPMSQLPPGRKPTYYRPVCADRPNKENPIRVRGTVGGNLINYPGDVSTKSAGLITAKITFNSVISTPGARCLVIDLKDFYLNNDMERYEYMRIPLKLIPQAIIDQYNLLSIAHNGHVLVEIRKGMYGLPQAGRIANDALVLHLAKDGYHQSKMIPGLFHHESRPVSFCLVVDDFGIKYVGKENAEHLINTLKSKYTITIDWEAKQFCGINLTWDYKNRTVDMDMPNYVGNALQRFEHTKLKAEDSPHHWIAPHYGKATQLTSPPDNSAPLSPADLKLVQQIVGVFLYYARAIDNTMLVALSSIASAQAKGTQATLKACRRLLDYAATHPDAKIRFNASDMVYWTHSDASYLSEPKAKSRAGGHHFLSTHPAKLKPGQSPPLNGPIHVLCALIGPVVASAAEAEVGAAFMNAQDGCPIRQTLIELGHPQPPTVLQTDNKCAEGILNDTIKQRRSKAIDMRFYWLRDRTTQGQWRIVWGPGKENHGDYFTKHFPPAHHREMHPIYLHVPQQSANRISTHQHPSLLREGVSKSQWHHVTGPSFHSNLAHSVRPGTTHCLPRFSQLHAGRPAFPQRCPLFALAHAQPWFGSIRH